MTITKTVKKVKGCVNSKVSMVEYEQVYQSWYTFILLNRIKF